MPYSFPETITPRRPEASGLRAKARLATARKVTAESSFCRVSCRRMNCWRWSLVVVQVAVGQQVQARLQLDQLDLVAAVDHGGVVRVGTDVVGPGIAAGGQLAGGVLGGLAGGGHRQQLAAQQAPRPRLGRDVDLGPVGDRREQAELVDAQPGAAGLAVDAADDPRLARLDPRGLRGAVKKFLPVVRQPGWGRSRRSGIGWPGYTWVFRCRDCLNRLM